MIIDNSSCMALYSVQSFDFIKVDHAYSKACFGISVEHKDWKVVFSGDTMPCDRLITAGGLFLLRA